VLQYCSKYWFESGNAILIDRFRSVAELFWSMINCKYFGNRSVYTVSFLIINLQLMSQSTFQYFWFLNSCSIWRYNLFVHFVQKIKRTDSKYFANGSELVNTKCCNVVQNIDSHLMMQLWSVGSDRLSRSCNYKWIWKKRLWNFFVNSFKI